MTYSYRRQFDLAGKTALVTGGGGILGRHFVAALAEHGAKVAVVDLDGGQAEAVAEQTRHNYGATVEAFVADVADKASVQHLQDQVEANLGPVDVLLNNAATKTANLENFFASVEDFDIEVWHEIMSVNLDGMFLMAQRFGAGMAERGHGSIIQTASIYGMLAPDQRIYEGSSYRGRAINTPAVYTASKAGVIGLTRHLATYWGHAGVRVNTLTPGGVESGQNEEFSRRYSARIPLGRMAEAEDITGAAVFLASDASRYVTGQNIAVDGGLSAW
ncbi:MAG: SDR family oxidoreductase [Candidatus Devosia symbiotica]|nr:SDR family oxidoreductase [Candidatus Devosia symbiotica]